MSNRHLILGPAREQRLENASADQFVLAADRDCARRTAHCQICHIERFDGVIRVGTAEGQQLGKCYAALVRKVSEALRVGCYQGRQKPVEPRGNRRVRREDITGACRAPGFPEWQPGAAPKRACSLDYRKGGVAFVQVTDFGVGRHLFDDAPAGHAEHQLLQQPDFVAIGV